MENESSGMKLNVAFEDVFCEHANTVMCVVEFPLFSCLHLDTRVIPFLVLNLGEFF